MRTVLSSLYFLWKLSLSLEREGEKARSRVQALKRPPAPTPPLLPPSLIFILTFILRKVVLKMGSTTYAKFSFEFSFEAFFPFNSSFG
jgi:hypothetical protein